MSSRSKRNPESAIEDAPPGGVDLGLLYALLDAKLGNGGAHADACISMGLAAAHRWGLMAHGRWTTKGHALLAEVAALVRRFEASPDARGSR